MYVQKTLYLALLTVLLSACSGNQQAEEMVMPVAVKLPQQQRLVDSVSVVGTLVANESVDIKSEIDGKVEVIEFQEGQAVKADSLLVKIDHKKLTAEVAEAKANFDLAEADLSRSKMLLARKTISSQEYDQALSAFNVRKASLELMRDRLDDALVKAPFDGVLGARLISPGQYLSSGTMLTSLVSLDPIKVEFSVPERFISRLQNSQAVEVEVAALPGATFKGVVFFIAPQVNTETRTVLVKAVIDNQDHKLKPGMFANLNLTLEEKENAVVIPESALMLQGEQVRVFVVDHEDRAQIKEIVVGKYLDGVVEVLSGIAVDEKIITEGIQKIGPGMKVFYQKSDTAAQSEN
ncbi:efflux RND transporter periplasmic adaptor subunit [Oligoflexia bacterium]|nr:efflux RND transporter periplasmic adaptor subunit [Oligoflexia bacterium]